MGEKVSIAFGRRSLALLICSHQDYAAFSIDTLIPLFLEDYKITRVETVSRFTILNEEESAASNLTSHGQTGHECKRKSKHHRFQYSIHIVNTKVSQ